jgi:hypothetical protein
MATLTVVVTFAEMLVPLRTSLEYPVARTRTSYVPGSRLPMEYVPFAALVAVPFTTPMSTAWIVAPDNADPFEVRVMVPLTVPVVTSVKVTPLLAFPDTVTTTGPVVAPAGTVVAMLVSLQLVGVAAVPLNVTVLAPSAWAARKYWPEIVTL